ncbi:chemotaxis protein CheB [Echinicola sp. CAU 1574]|uniref:protein-glutamate methylesterase n=1 Tax=Echinicola arenosa TaxID=2774144 RepID=A0ABR9ATS3_9BACT|nr:chemotaxis protein CheB [Echinicola arenosa]MBD8491300.1 chemotaxis protein CheB [Echinicola arenosa]
MTEEKTYIRRLCSTADIPTSALQPIELVVIGGSAGSMVVLMELMKSVSFFPIPIIFVIHRGKTSSFGTLAGIFQKANQEIKVKEAEEKETLSPKTIYLAPADYHLLVERDFSLSLDLSEKVWHSRPSIDVLFQSAADAGGKRTLGILLSGANADGVQGLQEIRKKGGLTIIQDPHTAEYPTMPNEALKAKAADYKLTPSKLERTFEKLKKVKLHF